MAWTIRKRWGIDSRSSALSNRGRFSPWRIQCWSEGGLQRRHQPSPSSHQAPTRFPSDCHQTSIKLPSNSHGKRLGRSPKFVASNAEIHSASRGEGKGRDRTRDGESLVTREMDINSALSPTSSHLNSTSSLPSNLITNKFIISNPQIHYVRRC